MPSLPAYTLVNPQTSNLDFRIFHFDGDNSFNHLQRLNYFSLILAEGKGKLKVDLSVYNFKNKTLMALTPYQPFMITGEEGFHGVVINFHSDFFCIHKHRKEVSCNGILFNDLYHPPIMELDDKDYDMLLSMIEPMQQEMQQAGLAQYEMLVSYLKIFLINASRLKAEVNQMKLGEMKPEPPVLQKLKDAIEMNFKTKHAPGEYSDMLNISAKALAKISKTHFNRTLTELISERIIMEAKRELYLTSKPVKEIAYELGFNDEHYFSRFFKNNADISPQMYRDTVGYGRG